VNETRAKNFRETLRKLLRSNDKVFGQSDSREEGIRLMQEHVDQETNELGRRVMKQRRVRIGTKHRSTYQTFMKNFPETAPDKIKKTEHCNRD
jgi:DnaJ-domain-containing protein 1